MEKNLEFLLPREPFNGKFHKNVYPFVPIHHEVVKFCENNYQNGMQFLKDFPEVYSTIRDQIESELINIGKLEPHQINWYMQKLDNQFNPNDNDDEFFFKELHLTRAKPYTMNGLANGNCDSISREMGFGLDYTNWEKSIGLDNALLLNNLRDKYADKNGSVTIVMSHNADIADFDHVLHKEWARTVNNEILKKLY